MPALHRVLIANRGEIAIRIANAAAGLNMQSVAVFAAADANCLHTRVADRAVELVGGTPGDPVSAYLDADALVAAARDSECDCLHPGYGFLSENARLAELCAAAGITFVGPAPATLSLFGDKVQARELARSLDIPVVPGSSTAVDSPQAAATRAGEVGYPVMLKAAAGGGGRGMRVVTAPSDMGEAFERCKSEAQAAFGSGALFVEKLIEHPRHIEVQVLADSTGNTVHLFERDCSVQLRHQKVLEIAPAPQLDADLRDAMLDAAVRLAKAANYVNAGTVEFLVAPESGTFHFIECNPRIQVEHTVTEQVTGVDLVEAQFHVAAGGRLADMGLPNQAALAAPRGFAIQARVVARGPGTLSAYREPSGPGLRVDGCGYPGYSPAPQFDPLLAKVIGSSNSSRSYASAVTRTLRALGEFHVSGIPTNLGQLRALLQNADVRAGNARTTLLDNPAALVDAPASAALELFERHTRAGGAPGAPPPATTPATSLQTAAGDTPVACPQDGAVIEVSAAAGDTVAAGDTLLVISAMKMETQVTAPCAGRVSDTLALHPGDSVSTGQVLMAITPDTSGTTAGVPAERRSDGWGPLLDDVAKLQSIAHARFATGSTDPGVVRQRSRGKLTCRERINQLLDEGSFREVGSLAGFASYDENGNIADFTPANHVGGTGTIERRPAIVCADDFTSRGGHADGAIGAKSLHLDRLSVQLRTPSIRLLDGSSGGGSVAAMVPKQKQDGEAEAKESSGAIKAGRPRVAGGGGSFLPGHLGSTQYTEQLTTVPVVNLLLGSVVGIGAAKAVLGHFSVMVRDVAQLFVAGPPVVSHAMGYDVTKEDLGGWHIHCRNGSVDNLAETEDEALDMARRFLSYLPSSVYEAPPVLAPNPSDPPDRRIDELFTIVPRKRTTTFDIRRTIELMADRGSLFETGALWGSDQVTGFVRFNGHPLGVIASDSRHANGGALTADGCSKLTRHLDLCDLFHIPVLNLVDNPGFAVGIEHEVAGTIRRGGEWMVAFSQVKVPIFTVLLRRSFGVAGNNYATPQLQPAARVVWPAADVGGIPPEGGIEAAYKRQLAEAEDPVAFRAALMERIESARGPIGPLSRFQMEEMIDPRDTRRLICEWLPTAYRVTSEPARLAPRALQFRP